PSRRSRYAGGDLRATLAHPAKERRVAEPDRVVAEVEHFLDRAVGIPLLLDDAVSGDGVAGAILTFGAMHEHRPAPRVGKGAMQRREEKHHVLRLGSPSAH